MSDLTKEEWAEVEKYVVPPIVRKLKARIAKLEAALRCLGEGEK